jgi:hypothetical protein
MLIKHARLLLIVLLALLITFAGLIFIRNLIDFPVYYRAGQSLLAGRTDLYAGDFALGRVMDYRYPPFFLLLFTPLWLLPYKVAAYLWYLLSIIQIAGAIFCLRELLKPSAISWKIWLLVFFAVGQYFIIILHYGNAHLLAISLLFASLYFALRRQDTRAAFLMALAITIKLTPAFLLLYFLFLRRWRYLLLVGAFLLVINLSPALYFGVSQNSQLLKGWYHHVIANQQFHELNGPINLSLKGQLQRYFTEVDYQQRVDGDTRYPAVNLFSMDSQDMARLWFLLSLALVIGVIVWFYWSSRRQPSDLRPNAEERNFFEGQSPEVMEKTLVQMGLLISLMLFVEPLTSKIYFIALLWPFAILAVVTTRKSGRGFRLVRSILLLIAILNFVLPLLPGRSTQRWLLVLGADFYVNLLMLVAQTVFLLSQRQSHRLPIVEPRRPAR